MTPPKDDEALDIENLGLTAEEAAALAEGEADDAATAATDKAEAAGADDIAALADAGKSKGEGDGDDEGAEGADADAKASADKATADAKAAADKAAADEAAAKAKADADTAAATTAKPDGAKPDGEVDQAGAEIDDDDEMAIAIPQAPADAEAKLKEIADKRVELAKKFDAGEITREDEIAAQMKLEAEQRTIQRAVDRAQDAADRVEQTWLNGTVPKFLKANPHYRDNEAMHSLLDTEVRRLQVEASKAGKNPLSASILAKADTNIKAQLKGMGIEPAPGAKPTGDGKPGDIKPKPGKPTIPPTLATMPATDINDTDGGEFAALDRLAQANPTAFEEAFAKLPEGKQNAYLAQN